MNNMPTINNGGQPYYFPADIAKEGEDYARLSNFFKTRVGDNGKILTLKWYDQGRVMNVHGFIPFIQGMVGKHYEEPDTKEIVMAPDALYREWQGSTDNGHDGGFMDYILEDQMFPQEGIFKGHFGLKDTNGNVLTSVNIVFEVLGNDLRVGETSKYYSAELDRLAREYEVKTDQMVADGTQKVDQFVAQTKNDINVSLQNSRDSLDALSGEIRANRAEQANISQHLTDTQQQIANYDIVTRPEFQTGMDTMNNAINSRLSQMKTNPIAVENAGELTKNYPNGADGIFITVDTGHKWVYLDGAWKDCGEYQAIGIGDELVDPIKQQQKIDEGNIANNYGLINKNTNQIKANTTDIQSIESSGKLTYVYITDQNGNRVTDQNNNELIGLKWLIITDKSLTQSDLPADAQSVGNAIDNIADKVNQNADHIQDVDDAGKFVQVDLVDQNGNYITDQNGIRFAFSKWLPIVDKTLTQSDLPADAKSVGEALKFDATKYNIPVLYLYSDQINTLKDKKGSLKNEVKYSFPRYGIQGTCTNFKVQGASSATLPKKNWTLNLDQDVAIFPQYGLQHKYVVKANMSDFTQAKNVVSAKLWGNLRKTHIQNKDTIQDSLGNYLTDQSGNHIVAETDPQLAIGGNVGSVDGFPICIYVNDKYWGLYTFNIPKDDWMAKMPKKQGYAIVDTIWSPQGSFQKETNLKDGIELQFCGTKDTNWVKDSINKLINACIGSYDDANSFDSAIAPYLDLDSAIDYLAFSILTNNVDGVIRNFLLQTFDGKKWYFAAYDLDRTFGAKPDDWYRFSVPNYVGPDLRRGGATFENFADANRLFHQIWKFHSTQVLDEVKNAIRSTMSVPVVDNIFTNFDSDIPFPAFLEETKKWSGTPAGVESLSRIYRWYEQRIYWIEQYYLSNK